MRYKIKQMVILIILFPILYSTATSQSPEQIKKQIAECEQSGDEQSIQTLLRHIRDKNEGIREQAAYAMGARTSCWCPHHGWATKIGKQNDPRVINALLKALEDESPRVRIATAHSLTVYKNPRMVEPLIKALNDTSGKAEYNGMHPVGAYAAYTLGEMGDERAVAPLIECLKSPEPRIRSYAKMALTALGKENSIKQEVKKLTPLYLENLKSSSVEIVENSVYWVMEFHIREAIPLLNGLINNKEPIIKKTASMALWEMGDKSSLPFVIKALKDPEPYVRSYSVKTVGRLGDKSHLPDIMNLLRDEDISVRTSALCALGSIDEPETIPPLKNTLYDSDLNLSRTAFYTLSRKFAENRGNPKSHKDIVPRILLMMKQMHPGDGHYYSGYQILSAIEDEQAIPMLYTDFQTRYQGRAEIDAAGECVIKMVGFLAKKGNASQKKEARDWLEVVSVKNPSKSYRKMAADILEKSRL